MTPQQEFSVAERSDNLFVAVLGGTLGRATIQLALILAGISAVAAALALIA